ncbi:MAG: hypothetical protein P4M15_12295 [Alphaproteobacteria bacterium]|nr:hypothetical protein [Alphaproteobacteria bacterium]
MTPNETVYDKIIVGGGVAGLAAAYKILQAAQKPVSNIKKP